MNKAIFLDRDGVINEDIEYVYKIKDFHVLPRVSEALELLKINGFKFIVITNQAGIGRGYYTEKEFLKLNNYMIDYFNKRKIRIEKTYYCSHHPNDNCECRKPKTKLLELAVKEFDIDLKKSWIIGDKLDDIKTGENAGCRTLLIESRYVKAVKIRKFKDLYEASQYILETDTKTNKNI